MASRRSIDLYHSNGGVRQQEWPKKDVGDLYQQGGMDLEKHKKDMVNHPEHYMKGGMETIEYLKAKSTPHGFQTYLRLNAMKYLSRAEEKENLVQDLEKALWYLNRLIKETKGN
jgi:hypothetical protein